MGKDSAQQQRPNFTRTSPAMRHEPGGMSSRTKSGCGPCTVIFGEHSSSPVTAGLCATGEPPRENHVHRSSSRRRGGQRRGDDPDFRAHVVQLRSAMLQRSLGRMADGMTEAAEVLRDLLNANSESVRLGACRAMLELGVKLRETIDHEERLRVLETRLKNGAPT